MSQFQLPLSTLSLSLFPFAHPLLVRPFRTTLPQLSASGDINFNCGSFSIQWEMLIQFSSRSQALFFSHSLRPPPLLSLSLSLSVGYLRSMCLAMRASERCLFAYQLADSSHSCSSYSNNKYTLTPIRQHLQMHRQLQIHIHRYSYSYWYR